MNFAQALEELKGGNLLARRGWSTPGIFVCKQIPSTIHVDVIPKMQSLPDAAKKFLVDRNTAIRYTNQMLIIHADGRADSWVPSVSDVLSEDWYRINNPTPEGVVE